MSVGDALLALLACGGNPTGAAVVMGMGAYADTAKECAERGLPPEQMQAAALAAGMFEYAFERIKWEKIGLIAKGEASGNLFWDMGGAALTNGLEEIGTDLCVTASDILINGGASEMVMMYNGYVEGGMEGEEAARRVMGEYARELALEGLAGAVAGGILGGAAGIAGRSGNGSVTVDVKAGVDGSVEVEGISGVHGGDVRADVDGFEGGSYASPNKIGSLLDGRPELTGSTRDKLLSTIQDSELSKIVNELYRPEATVGDGGTAAILVEEFSNGSSTHLLKATERLKQLKKLASSGKLGLNDLDIVEALIDDLESAISLYD